MEQTFPNKDELRKAFLTLLEGQVGKGVYVWGGNGELLDGMTDAEDWIRRHETGEAEAKRAIALYRKRVAAKVQNVRAFDCSGLVYWALKEVGVQKTDVNSRGLYALCEPIGEDDLYAGDLVFHHDGKQIVHVGVCVGTEQIECRGRDYGVVKNKRRAGYWNRFGRLKAICEPSKPSYVKVLGGSVRVRKGDNTSTACIGIAHRGDRFPLLGVGTSGWYRIAYRNGEAYITNRPRYTEVQHG